MKRLDEPSSATIQIPADYVVEWYVENNTERYKRLAIVGVPTVEVPTFNHRSRQSCTKQQPTHAVVCSVMEVPLAKLESITSQLKKSQRLRPCASYLASAAMAADGAGEMRDHLAALEMENKLLRELALDHAKKLDGYDEGINQTEEHLDESLRHKIEPHGAPPFNIVPGWGKVPGLMAIGKRWQESTKQRLASIEAIAKVELARVRSALDEKRADVAAKLLRDLPDGEW